MSDRILDAIPHRPPMLLIDEVLQESEDSIRCRKSFGEDEFFVQGHYPGSPIVPGMILCESAMQAGAVLLAKLVEGSGGVPVVTRMNNVKFKRIIRPGDTVDLSVALSERLADAFFLTAKVLLEGKLAARLDFACTITSPS